MTAGECIADRARGNTSSCELERRYDIDREAALRALCDQKIRRARARIAEMKIESDHRARNRQPIDQDAADEFLGGQTCKCSVEFEQDCAIKVGGRQQSQLAGLRTQAERRCLRLKVAAGVRLESKHGGGPADGVRACDRRRNHGTVAAMKPVKIADGDRGVPQRLG